MGKTRGKCGKGIKDNANTVWLTRRNLAIMLVFVTAAFIVAIGIWGYSYIGSINANDNDIPAESTSTLALTPTEDAMAESIAEEPTTGPIIEEVLYEDEHEEAYQEVYQEEYEEVYQEAYEEVYQEEYEEVYQEEYEEVYQEEYGEVYQEEYEQGTFATGDGTEESPYIIITSQQLSNVRNDLGCYYKLGCNIELNGDMLEIIGFGKFASGKWNAESGFQGVFDGDGYTISGLNIDSRFQCTGLFAAVGSNGVIKNLNVSGQAKTSGRDNNNAIGLITGYNCGLIENCSVIATVEGSGSYAMVGGLVGTNEGLIQFCNSEGIVKGWGEYVKTGGLVGLNLPSGQINYCKNKAIVSSEYRAGEIAGLDEGKMTGNESSGEII